MESLNIMSEKEDIIIKCPLEEMIRHFFKDYVVVWHDPHVNSQENQKYLAQLRKFCRVFTFTEWEKASIAVNITKEICHVITSGTDGELLVKEICISKNVATISVFCANKEHHSTWAKDYLKISCVETEIEKIFNQIKQHLMERYKQLSMLKLNLPAFAPIFNDSDKSQMNHLHRFLQAIPDFKNREQAKKDFLALSRGIYSEKKETDKIENFEKTYTEYNKEAILTWYTQQSFLFKVVNNCLRIATSDSIQYSRFVLRDIESAIKDQYQTKSKGFSGYLFRAAYLSAEEWNSLKTNVNQEIEMHGFLSVTKDQTVALKFMGVNPAEKVLITIIVPKGPNEEEQGFAEIEEFSKFPKEKEVLFNVRSRFTVLATEDEYSKEKPHRHLVLLYGAQSFRKFVAEENPIQEVQIPSIENFSCAHCKIPAKEMLEKIAFKSLAEEIYYCKKCAYKADVKDVSAPLLCIPIANHPTMLKIHGCLLLNSMRTEAEMPFYGYECLHCQTQKQKRFFTCTGCQKKFCENCFENEVNSFEISHNFLLETSPFSFWCEKMSKNELIHLRYQNQIIPPRELFKQGTMYLESHQYGKAHEYFNQYIQQNESKGMDISLANAYSNVGTIIERQGEYRKALEYFLKSVEIRKAISEEIHPDSGITYGNIGAAYANLGEYENALEYHLKSLEIRRAVHKGDHIHIALSYVYIASLYINLAKFTKALEFSLRALFMFKSVCGENHPQVAAAYSHISSVFHNQGQTLKALQNGLKALEINKVVYGENHPEVASLYHNLGTIYLCQEDFDKAIEYFSTSLEIKKLVFGEFHPDVAISLDSIGAVYQSQKDYQKAFEYISKALDMKKAIHGESHPNVATSYHNLGEVCRSQGEFKKAFEYLAKALEIGKSLHGEIHPIVSLSYFHLGTLYKRFGEVKKGIDFCLKSAEIDKEIFGENHPKLANSYQTISLIYHSIEDEQSALEFSMKALAIYKSLHGENHADIARSYNNISTLLFTLGEYQKALESQMKALAIYKNLYGENHADTAKSCLELGIIYYQLGEPMKGLEYHLKCLEICEEVFGNNHPQTMVYRIKILQLRSVFGE